MQDTHQFLLFHHPDRDLSPFSAALDEDGVGLVPVRSLEDVRLDPAALGVVFLDENLLDATPSFDPAHIPGFGLNVRFVAVESPHVLERVPDGRIYLFISDPPQRRPFIKALRAAFFHIYHMQHTRAVEEELRLRIENLRILNEIGVALSTEHDHDALLALILRKAREFVNCDAGSLYLLEDTAGGAHLRFKLTQNDSIEVPFSEFTLPVSEESLAGYVAKTGQTLNIADVYQLPGDVPYRFNKAFDEKVGYRTQSMVVLPMSDHLGKMIGVLQLINRKRTRPGVRLTPATTAAEVTEFADEQIQLLRSLASQAAVCLENNILYDNIQRLFEGFVTASVTAIEQRDPTTSGHSSRVASYTVRLARLADGASDGPFSALRFSREQLRELRYASLLHDFGKVGVREDVLVKAKKLYPHELRDIERRFQYIARTLQWRMEKERAEAMERELPREAILEGIAEQQKRIDQLWRFWSTVTASNEPTVLPDGDFQLLSEIAGQVFEGPEGEALPYLEPREVEILSLRKGSLTPGERLEIESHVTHTFRFLSKIPWTEDLQDVPRIAFSHHEKLNGRGYPRGLGAPEIPPQARMMTVSDIYDALAAKDRPYKRAVPPEKALDILRMEAKDGMLDPDLVTLFIDGKVWTIDTLPNGDVA